MERATCSRQGASSTVAIGVSMVEEGFDFGIVEQLTAACGGTTRPELAAYNGDRRSRDKMPADVQKESAT